MKSYEKKSFIQIFLGYFISVTIFILLLGFLYFNQQKTFLMQKTAMSMHQYLTSVKQSNFSFIQDGFKYEVVKNIKVKKQLPQKEGNYYVKAFSKYFIVKIDAKVVDQELEEIRVFTILLQVLLICLFAFISLLLAKKSIEPMVDTISHLDRFVSDLVHDLNTPVTSILLNTKMLRKDANEKDLKKISRIENSAKNISALYSNLEVLLDGNTLVKEKFDLAVLSVNIIEMYKSLYPQIKFKFTNKSMIVLSNQNAMKRIIDNIISNACKYSIDKNPTICIDFNNNQLTIKDNGKGIKYPEKIFERQYKESDDGHGIGMHIVHRLCEQLSHKISIKSKGRVEQDKIQPQGTTISILF